MQSIYKLLMRSFIFLFPYRVLGCSVSLYSQHVSFQMRHISRTSSPRVGHGCSTVPEAGWPAGSWKSRQAVIWREEGKKSEDVEISIRWMLGCARKWWMTEKMAVSYNHWHGNFCFFEGEAYESFAGQMNELSSRKLEMGVWKSEEASGWRLRIALW